MTLLDSLVAEGFGEPAAPPRSRPVTKPQAVNGRPYDVANGVDTLAILDWLGVEHEPSSRGEMAKCPGCGEHGALVCRDGGVKCLHDRCSSEGKSGFRSNVDIVAKVHGIDPSEAVRRIAVQFGLGSPRVSRIQPRRSEALPLDDDWVPCDEDAPDAPPKESGLGQSTANPERLQAAADLSGEVLSLIEARATGEEKPIPVPFVDYQTATNGGIWCGSVETIVGLTGSMKSQFVSQKTIHAATSGVPCLVVTLELTPVQETLRLLCDFAGVSWSRCEDGRASSRDLDGLRASKADFDKLPIKVEYGLPQVFTPASLEGMIQRFRREVQGPIYVVVDFAQLVGADSQGQEARERIGHVFYGLQGVARRTGVALTAVSSTARQNYALLSDVEQAAKLYVDKGERLVGNPAAVLSAAKESGEAEYASDTLWVLCKWPAKLENGDQVILAVQGKRRFGPCCWFAMAAHNGRLIEFRVDSMADLPGGASDGAGEVPEDEYVRRVVETVTRHPGELKSVNDVVKMTKGKLTRIREALKTARQDGLVTESQDGTLCVGGTHL